MFQLIPIDKRKGKRCHFCGTTLSVKYEIDINAYTIMCDDRAKFPFEKYVIAR